MVAPAGIEPATRGFSVLCSTDWAMKPQMAVPTGFEPAIFCVTGRRDGPLHYGTLKWLREMDLNQRPLGYEPSELPSCSIPRYYMAEEKGFEPLRRLHDLPVFKTGPFNQTWVFLHFCHLFQTTKWLYHSLFFDVNIFLSFFYNTII